jgi:hypothetical protein
MKMPVPGLQRSLLSLAVMAAFAAPAAQAATITVAPTSVDAAVAGDGLCSLREAVLSVNAGADQGDCVAVVTEAYGTNDTIVLPAGTYTLALSGLDETYTDAAPGDPNGVPTVSNVPDATVGDLDLQKSVKIVGAGAATTKIEWDAAAVAPDRIFHVIAATGTVNVEVQGVTLTKGVTREVNIKNGPASGSGALATVYYLRRAGGALAVGPGAAVVLIDPNVTGDANSAGRGGSQKPGEPEPGGATYSLTLTNVIVEGNSAQGDGGGVYTAAAMTVTGSIVRNNTASTNGGGVYNEGNTTLGATTISGNQAEGGGGFFGTGSNTVNIAGVTLSGNTAIGGGAISGRSGVTMNIVNSTISGNIGSDVGAGLYTNGTANLNFVTIAQNLAGADSPEAGSGINVFPASTTANTVTLKNVLLSGNKRAWLAGMDAAAIAALPSANCGLTGNGIPVVSSGGNLSADANCSTWLDDTSDKNGLDPLIGDLADNGGPTQTHALLTGSPALGAGKADATVTVDQRGTTRDATPDIGAYEVPTPPAPPSSGDGGGGGGCTTNPNAGFDAGLLGLLGAAMAGLFLRRRRQGKAG